MKKFREGGIISGESMFKDLNEECFHPSVKFDLSKIDPKFIEICRDYFASNEFKELKEKYGYTLDSDEKNIK